MSAKQGVGVFCLAAACLTSTVAAQQPDCPVDSLLAQPPDTPGGFLWGMSESAGSIKRLENYTGAIGLIDGVTWFGVEMSSPTTGCLDSNPEFDISFHEDAAGQPGAAVCSFTLVAARTPTGVLYGPSGIELNEYSVTLPAPCALVNGWISIVGLGDSGCRFMWLSSSAGDGTSHCDACSPSIRSFDLNFCFSGTPGGIFGACCDDRTGLCEDNIEVTDCQESGERFVQDTLRQQIVEPCSQVAGACCFEDNTCTYTESDCLSFGGQWLGLGSDCVDCPRYPSCDPAWLYSQLPGAAPEFATGWTSELGSGFHRYDNFSRAAGEIEGVRFWGWELRRVGQHWEICEEIDTTFVVSFYEEFANSPGMIVCSYTLTATRIKTGVMYGSEGNPYELMEYEVVLPQTCTLARGWVSVLGLGDGGCWFLWASSPSGDGMSYCDGCQSSETTDLSFCLVGTEGGVFGACCEEVAATCTGNVEIVDCLDYGQRFAPGTPCLQMFPVCGELTGACCREGGVCTIELRGICDGLQGEWIGPGTDCIDCPIWGACCQGETGCSIEKEDPCLSEGAYWAGPNTVCEDCPTMPICSGDLLFSQPVLDPGVFVSVGPSEFGVAQRMDNFTGVAGAIERLTWWGLDLRNTGGINFEECVELDNTFEISFYEDAAGMPGDLVFTYWLVATRTPMQLLYNGMELNEYQVTLTTPIVMVNGWVSLVGVGDPSCWFMWMGSQIGDDSSYCSNCFPPVSLGDLSFCLHGTEGGVFGACCDELAVPPTCGDSTEIVDCVTPGLIFTPDTLCEQLQPACGVILGACCLGDQCSMEEEVDCAALGGVWTGAHSHCQYCPCVVPSPAECIAEGEPLCGPGYVDEYNGGCDAAIPTFLPLAFGSTLCGKSGNYQTGGQTRADSDWYEITAPSVVSVLVFVEAEFPVYAAVISGDAGCPPLPGDILASNVAEPCEPMQLAVFVDPGRYFLLVTPLPTMDAGECGLEYVVDIPSPITCSDPGDINFDFAVNGHDISTFVECMLTGSTIFGDCFCADLDGINGITLDDAEILVSLLLGP